MEGQDNLKKENKALAGIKNAVEGEKKGPFKRSDDPKYQERQREIDE